MSTTASIFRPADHWLKSYYAVRALVSACWVALAFTIGRSHPPIAVALIVAYPLWDCLANYVDASRNGGLRANPTQMLNVIVSAIVTLAVVGTVSHGFHAVIAVIGAWATLSGILQLSTAVRRWRSADAQWPMILSGAQSALAGLFFVKQATDASTTLGIADVAPYAAFGAIYFAISALVLVLRRR
jgi:hypothetical protein